MKTFIRKCREAHDLSGFIYPGKCECQKVAKRNVTRYIVYELLEPENR